MKKPLTILALLTSTLSVAAEAPSIRIEEPAAGDLLQGRTTLSARVQPPPDVTVVSVSFRVDGRVLGEDATAPYEVEWTDIDTLRDHLIRATAQFSDGTRAYDLRSIPVLGMVTRATVLGDAPDQVLLAVTFLDGDGQPITDVAVEDVQVRENGKRQEVSLFEPDTRPLAVQLLLDASHSTRPYWTDLARSTGLFAQTLRPGDRAGVEAFNDRSFELAPLGSPASEIETATSRFVDWGGGTLLYDVLTRAALLTVGREREGRRALVLLSDADDFGSVLELDDALDYLVRADVQVHTVVWFPDNRTATGSIRRSTDLGRLHRAMERLVQATGGVQLEYSDLPLEEAFLRIGERLRSQYLLGYTSYSRREPGLQRDIEVQLRRSGRHRVRYRLYHHGGQSLGELLAEQIRNEPLERRLVAMQAAALHVEPAVVQALVDTLFEGPDVVSGLALEARLTLLHLGPVSVPYLRDAMAQGTEETAARAVQVLADLFVVLHRSGNAEGMDEALALLGRGDSGAGRRALIGLQERSLLPETRTALTRMLQQGDVP